MLPHRTIVFFVLPTLFACADAVRPVTGEVRVVAPEDQKLDFGAIYLGSAITRAVTLLNESRASRPVAVRMEGPFELTAPVEQLPGGAQVDLMVRTTAVEAGPAAGQLELVLEDDVIRFELSAQVMPVPACASTPCRDAHFDPTLEHCVHSEKPDGTSCADACAPNAICLGGECVGERISCDDGEPCTDDACDPARGCVAMPRSCPAAEAPCKAAVCDPGSGCRVVDVADGTNCGRRGCDVQDVCIAGACVPRPAPEGAACGEASPCQPLGRCVAGACERASPSALTPEWTYLLPDGALTGPLAADEEGNLYFFARNEATAETSVHSIDRSGRHRWTAPVAGAPRHISNAMIAGGTLVFAHGSRDGEIQAVRVSDGALLWMTKLATLLVPQLATKNTGTITAREVYPEQLTDFEDGDIAAVMRGFVGFEKANPVYRGPAGLFLVKLSASTGQPLWYRRLGDYGGAHVAANDRGYVYVDAAEVTIPFNYMYANHPEAEISTYAFDSSGQQRWSIAQGLAPDYFGGGGGTMAALAETVITSEDWRSSLECRNADSGALIGRLEISRAGPVTMTDRALLLIASAPEDWRQRSLVSIDTATCHERWRRSLPEVVPDSRATLALTREGVLAIVPATQWADPPIAPSVRHVREDGTTLFQCAFGSTSKSWKEQFLGTEHLIAADARRIEAFPLPGIRPPEHGWVAPAGTALHTLRPR